MLTIGSGTNTNLLTTGGSAAALRDGLSAPPASADAAPRMTGAALRHQQSTISHHVDAALIQGFAPGLVHEGQDIERRDTYLAMHLQDRSDPLATSRAVSSWNRLAASHVTSVAGAAVQAHRDDFIQAYLCCVLECGKAPGLIFAGKNIEDRQAWIAASARDGESSDEVSAGRQWNWLATEHTRHVASAIYIRQHPLTRAGLGRPGEMVSSLSGTDTRMQFHMGQSAQILMQISQASGPVPSGGMDLLPAGAPSPKAAGHDEERQLEMPHPAMPYSEKNYARFQAGHRGLSRVFLEEFMRNAPNTLLFKIYIDPALQDNQHDLQEMASKVLYERRN